MTGGILVTAIRKTPPSPRRVRVHGDLYHGRVPSGAIYVGRQAPGLRRSPWANPARVIDGDRATAVREYRRWLATHPTLVARARAELAGRDLACWCPVGQPCHADVLLELANDGSKRIEPTARREGGGSAT